ncbi:hypothetical protein M0R45_006755 [Rubus argutus]|uniref:Uncharacterized protein n=1 Tax=Rubus argutus TaxID=59490 RepID=A0AAW1YRG9_RUBAR
MIWVGESETEKSKTWVLIDLILLEITIENEGKGGCNEESDRTGGNEEEKGRVEIVSIPKLLNSDILTEY